MKDFTDRVAAFSPEKAAERRIRAIGRQDLYISTYREQREDPRRRTARRGAMFEAHMARSQRAARRS